MEEGEQEHLQRQVSDSRVHVHLQNHHCCPENASVQKKKRKYGLLTANYKSFKSQHVITSTKMV